MTVTYVVANAFVLTADDRRENDLREMESSLTENEKFLLRRLDEERSGEASRQRRSGGRE